MERQGEGYVISVDGQSMEFVVTNGEGNWDKPVGEGKRNYVISKGGNYALKRGVLKKE